jgi:hypothetical protein
VITLATEDTMAYDQTYEGWSNWATWNIELWINNNEYMYEEKIKLLKRHGSDITDDIVKDFVAEMFDDSKTPDMDDNDVNNVNWEELATEWNHEYKVDWEPQIPAMVTDDSLPFIGGYITINGKKINGISWKQSELGTSITITNDGEIETFHSKAALELYLYMNF